MVSNNAVSLDRALLGEPSSVLPLFWEVAGSPEECGIQAALMRIFAAAGYSSLLIPVKDRDEAADVLSSPDLASRVHPHSLWENQPAWYVSVRDVSQGLIAESPTGIVPVSILFSNTSSGSDMPPEPDHGIAFILDASLPAAPPPERMAEVLAQYLFSAWLNYWQSRDADFHQAFSLYEPGRLYYLGLSWTGPEWSNLIVRRTGGILKEMHQRWLSTTQAPPNHPYPSFDELIRLAVSEQGYRILENENEAPQVKIDNGEEKLWVKMIEPIRLKRNNRWSRRLGELLEAGQMVVTFSTRNAIRWANIAIGKRFKLAKSRDSNYLNPFEEEHADRACLKAIEKRMDYLGARLGDIDPLDVEDCFDIRSLEENISALKRKILGQPLLKSAFIRLALIGVGCAWLFIGGAIWTDGAFTAMDYATRLQGGAVIGGAYLLLVFLLVGRWIYYRFGILRQEDLTVRDISATAARSLSDSIVNFTRSEVKSARSELHARKNNFTLLKQTLRDDLVEELDEEDLDTDPRFPPAKLEGVFQTHFEQTVCKAQDIFALRMSQADFDLDSKIWIREARESARSALIGVTESISFEDVADECDLSPSERESLMKQTVQNARRILLKDAPDTQIQALVFVADSWRQHLGGRDTTELRDDPVPRNGLMGVCALPASKLI